MVCPHSISFGSSLHLRHNETIASIKGDITELVHKFSIESMEQTPGDASDIFDSIVLLDETLCQEGFKDGYRDGLKTGEEEGREVGLKMGFQVGEELGFYQGCVDVWNSLIQVDPGSFSSRLQKSIQQLRDLLKKYPLLDPENEHVQEMMDAIRLKFRIISSNMGVKLEYYPKSSKQGMEDM